MTTDEGLQASKSLSEDIADAYAESAKDEVPDSPVVEDVAEEAPEPVLEQLQPPPKWKKEYKEVFNKWGELDGGRDWQKAMLDMYTEGQGYTTQVEQERAKLREYAQQLTPIQQAIQPYEQMILSTGLTPDNFIRQALGLSHKLATNPQATIMELAQRAGLDLSQLSQDQPYVDPQFKQLQNELSEMKRIFQQREQRQVMEYQNRIRQESDAEVQKFAGATDESGDLLHPHLELVQDTMVALISGREALRQRDPSKPSLTLQEAYDQACKLSDEVAQADTRAKEAKAAAARDAKAKKEAEASKRVSGKSTGKDDAPEETLRGEIEKLVRKQMAA